MAFKFSLRSSSHRKPMRPQKWRYVGQSDRTMIASTERPKSNPGTKAVIFIKGHNGILSAQTASTFLRFD